MLLAATMRRSIPAQRLQDGRYRITPSGWPFVVSTGEWRVLDLLNTAGAMTLGQLTEALPEIDTAHAANRLIQMSLLFALSPSDHARVNWLAGFGLEGCAEE